MSTRVTIIPLQSSQTGLTLSAQLTDTTGTNSGAAITTGFAELGNGFYLWYYASFASQFRGSVKFLSAGTIVAALAINPEEAENLDTPVSGVPASVWGVASRTLSAFAFSVTVGTNNDKIGYSLNLAQTGLSPRALDAVADSALTVGDGLVCAIASAAGKESVVSTAYTVKTPSTGTTIRNFTLDVSPNPTQRN
jgi:hypothetical protein